MSLWDKYVVQILLPCVCPAVGTSVSVKCNPYQTSSLLASSLAEVFSSVLSVALHEEVQRIL